MVILLLRAQKCLPTGVIFSELISIACLFIDTTNRKSMQYYVAYIEVYRPVMFFSVYGVSFTLSCSVGKVVPPVVILFTSFIIAFLVWHGKLCEKIEIIL